MNSDRELGHAKFERMRSLKSYLSEGSLDSMQKRGIEALDTSKIKEISNALIRGSMSKINESARYTKDIVSSAREEVMNSERSPSLEVSKIMRNKPNKLPKLQPLNQDSPSIKLLPDLNHNNISAFLNTTTSSKSTPQLVPFFTVTNSVTRAGFKSRVGSIKGKPKLKNQDSVIIQANLMKIRGQYLFGVCDGHGQNGHLISEHIKDNFSNILQLHLPHEPNSDSAKNALIQATLKMEDSLKSTKIDRTFSGSTMITVLITGSTVLTASLGDCKAVVGNSANRWQAVPLYCLHNLQNKKERGRMVKNHARIVEETGEVIGSEKAYMGEENTPGLEITRSIGDKIGKYIGVSSSPEVKEYQLTPDDKFIIIGSTGLWKMLTDIEAVLITRPSWEEKKVEVACEDLISEANRRWTSQDKDKEDISVIVVFLG